MGFQNVRALIRVNHDGVERVPGQTTGKNQQDFVVSDAQATSLIQSGAVTSLGTAVEPKTSATVSMQVGVETGANGGLDDKSREAVERTRKGANYVRGVFMLDQKGTASVLPVDSGFKPVATSFGPSMAGANQPWANAGYLTTYANGGTSFWEVPNSYINCKPKTTPIKHHYGIRRAPEAGNSATVIASCTDTTSKCGYLLQIAQSAHATNPNMLALRVFANGVFNQVSGYTSVAVADDADHAVDVNFDPETSVFTIDVDGVTVFTSAAVVFSDTDTFTEVLRIGSVGVGAPAGASVDCKWFSFVPAVFDGLSALPRNIKELSRFGNISRRTGIWGAPVFP